jgi:hypothetical protein
LEINGCDGALLLRLTVARPFDHLVGRAQIIFLSVAPTSGETPSAARSERVGQMIH